MWFHVLDISNLGSKIRNITSSKERLSDKEIDGLIKMLGLRKSNEYIPHFDPKESDKLLAQSIKEFSYIIKIREYLRKHSSAPNIKLLFDNNRHSKFCNEELQSREVRYRLAQRDLSIKIEGKFDQIVLEINKIQEKSNIKVDLSNYNAENIDQLFPNLHLQDPHNLNLGEDELKFYLEVIIQVHNELGLFSAEISSIFWELVFNNCKNQTRLFSLFNLVEKLYSKILQSTWYPGFLPNDTFKTVRPISVMWASNILYSLNDKVLHYRRYCKESYLQAYNANYISEIYLPDRIYNVATTVVDGIREILPNECYQKVLKILNLNWMFLKKIELSDFCVTFNNEYIFNLYNDKFSWDSVPWDKKSNSLLLTQTLLKGILNRNFRSTYSLPDFLNEKQETKLVELNSEIDKISEILNFSRFKTPKQFNMEYYNHFKDGYFAPIADITNYIRTQLDFESKDLSETYLYNSYVSNELYNKLIEHFIHGREKRMQVLRESTRMVKALSQPIPNPIKSIGNKEFLFGYNDIKDQIREHLQLILKPTRKKYIKEKNPDGILLYGLPGCGKTFFSRWIANLIGYEYHEIKLSEFGSKYINESSIRLKKRIEELNQKSGRVIFFDEFDSVAANRDKSDINQENLKVVNTLLQEIEKITINNNLVIAATNFIRKLDDAATRPGRFGLKLPIFPPNYEERIQIFHRLLMNDFTDDSVIQNYLETNGLNQASFWYPLIKKMKLFTNADLSRIAQDTRNRIIEALEDKKNVNINDFIDLPAKIRIECNMYLNFVNEVSETYFEYYQERLTLLYAEIVEKCPIEKRSWKEIKGFRP